MIKYLTAERNRLMSNFTILGLMLFNVAQAQTVATDLPKEKQTTPGLYVTAKQAYEMVSANPNDIKILDVRTPEEYIFIGHAEMAWNVPLLFQTYEWNADRQMFTMKPNEDFLAKIQEVFQPTDTILVTCRSGGRSAMAVNRLAEAGYKFVYSITDGMEGDAITDPNNPRKGQRLLNGWKNAGIPWTYKIDPAKLLLSNVK